MPDSRKFRSSYRHDPRGDREPEVVVYTLCLEQVEAKEFVAEFGEIGEVCVRKGTMYVTVGVSGTTIDDLFSENQMRLRRFSVGSMYKRYGFEISSERARRKENKRTQSRGEEEE